MKITCGGMCPKYYIMLLAFMVSLLSGSASHSIALTDSTAYVKHSSQYYKSSLSLRIFAKSASALRAMAPPIIDGNVSEWEDARVPMVDFNAYTSDTVAGPWPSYSDFRAFVYSAWDMRYLYIAARIYDESIWTDSATLWQDDEIEVAFDGLNDSVGWQWDDHQVTIAADGRAADFGTRPSVVDSAVHRYNDGWGVEFRIEWSKLISSSPHAGRVVGFNLGYNDDDNGGYRETHLVWSGNSTTNSQGYGQLQLASTTVYLSQPPTPTPTPTYTPTPPPAVYPDAYEPDNSCGSARWIYPGTSQRHNFHRSDDVDWMKFRAVSGNTYILETKDLAAHADTVMALYQPDCATVIASDDDGGPGRGSRIEWKASVNGVYKVKVRPFSSSNTGSESGYTLILSEITPTPTPTPTPHVWSGKVAVPVLIQGEPLCDIYEINNNRFVNAWGPLRFGQTYRAYLCQNDTEDNYFFDLSTPLSVQITVHIPLTLVNHTAMWVYTDMDLIHPLSNCSNGHISQSDFSKECRLSHIGRYFIRLYTEDPNRFFENFLPYTIRIDRR